VATTWKFTTKTGTSLFITVETWMQVLIGSAYAIVVLKSAQLVSEHFASWLVVAYVILMTITVGDTVHWLHKRRVKEVSE